MVLICKSNSNSERVEEINTTIPAKKHSHTFKFNNMVNNIY